MEDLGYKAKYRAYLSEQVGGGRAAVKHADGIQLP